MHCAVRPAASRLPFQQLDGACLSPGLRRLAGREASAQAVDPAILRPAVLAPQRGRKSVGCA